MNGSEQRVNVRYSTLHSNLKNKVRRSNETTHLWLFASTLSSRKNLYGALRVWELRIVFQQLAELLSYHPMPIARSVRI